MLLTVEGGPSPVLNDHSSMDVARVLVNDTRVPAANGSRSTRHQTVETILRSSMRETMWLLVQQTFLFAQLSCSLPRIQLRATDLFKGLAIESLK